SQFAPITITSLSRIVPAVGDYNVDGALDQSDYTEWGRAYGCSSQSCGPADGNHDGVVDGGDYVLWRHAAASAGGGLGTSESVPEPSGLMLSLLVGTGCASVRLGTGQGRAGN